MPQAGSRPRVELSPQACDICRRRKVKCHVQGAQPGSNSRCERCERLNLACTFILPSETRGSKKRYAYLYIQVLCENVAHFVPRASVVVPSVKDHHVSGTQYRTDDLCDRGLFKMIMQDFLDSIYPMVLSCTAHPSWKLSMRIGTTKMTGFSPWQSLSLLWSWQRWPPSFAFISLTLRLYDSHLEKRWYTSAIKGTCLASILLL